MYFLRKVTNKEDAYRRIIYYYDIIDKRDRSEEEYEEEPNAFCEDHFGLCSNDVLEDLNWTECFLDPNSMLSRAVEQKLAYIRLFFGPCGHLCLQSSSEYSRLITHYPEVLLHLNNFQNSIEKLLSENYFLFEQFNLMLRGTPLKSFPRKTLFVVTIKSELNRDSLRLVEKSRPLYEFELSYNSPVQYERVEYEYVRFRLIDNEPYISVIPSHDVKVDFDMTNDEENLDLMHVSFLTYLYMRYAELFDKGPVTSHEYLYQKLHGTKKILASDFILP